MGRDAEGETVYTLFPGSENPGSREVPPTPWGVIQTYHMDRDVWTTTALPPQLPDVLYGPACVSDLQNNMGYISGGESRQAGSENQYAATLYRYHPGTGAVEELPKMTTPRSQHAAWLWGGMICVAGGIDESGSLDSTQCFDLSAGSWNPENSDLPRLPKPCSGMAYDLLKGNPFLAGAYGSRDSGPWIPVALTYDPARGTWENLSSPPRARINASGVTLNGAFHLMGGQKRLQGRVLDSTTHQILTLCDIAPPLPLNIRANGSDGPITVTPNDPVGISVSLDPGDKAGQNADWWVAVNTPFTPPGDWYTFVYPGLNWLPGVNLCTQTGLFDLAPYEVLNMTLPVGTYTFYFALDDPDGMATGPWWGMDSVEVRVE